MSYFIPKKKNQILFGAGTAEKFFGNPKYFFLYLSRNKNPFNVFWITKNKKIIEELEKNDLPVLYFYSIKGIMAILRSNFLMFSHDISDISYSLYLPGKFKKILLMHGAPFKKLVTDHKMKGSNNNKMSFRNKLRFRELRSLYTILATSEEAVPIIMNEFDNKNVKLLGYPRNDVFIDEQLSYNNFTKLNLNKYEKVFIYCPTWRDVSTSKIPFSKHFLEKLNKSLQSKNYLLIDKRHINENDAKVQSSFSNIRNMSQIDDIQELLMQTDVLITDYSSIAFDYSLLNKPIIFYCYDYDEYLQLCRSVYWDYYNLFPGPFAKTEEVLLQTIMSIEKIFSDRDYQKKYDTFRKRFNHYLDGKSNERLLSFLKNN